MALSDKEKERLITGLAMKDEMENTNQTYSSSSSSRMSPAGAGAILFSIFAFICGLFLKGIKAMGESGILISACSFVVFPLVIIYQCKSIKDKKRQIRANTIEKNKEGGIYAFFMCIAVVGILLSLLIACISFNDFINDIYYPIEWYVYLSENTSLTAEMIKVEVMSCIAENMTSYISALFNIEIFVASLLSAKKNKYKYDYVFLGLDSKKEDN